MRACGRRFRRLLIDRPGCSRISVVIGIFVLLLLGMLARVILLIRLLRLIVICAHILVCLWRRLLFDCARRCVGKDEALPPAHPDHGSTYLYKTGKREYVPYELRVHGQLFHAIEGCYQRYRDPPSGIHLCSEFNYLRLNQKTIENAPVGGGRSPGPCFAG